MPLYTIHEQYPHRDVASFDTLEAAREYLIVHEGELNFPIVTFNSHSFSELQMLHGKTPSYVDFCERNGIK